MMRLGVTVVCREAPGLPSPLAGAAGPGPSPSPLVPTLARNGPGPGARKRRPGRQRYPFIPTDSDSLRLGQIPTESESRAALWSGLGEREERLREARESERESIPRRALCRPASDQVVTVSRRVETQSVLLRVSDHNSLVLSSSPVSKQGLTVTDSESVTEPGSPHWVRQQGLTDCHSESGWARL
jgi:hypothetical protein